MEEKNIVEIVEISNEEDTIKNTSYLEDEFRVIADNFKKSIQKMIC